MFLCLVVRDWSLITGRGGGYKTVGGGESQVSPLQKREWKKF